MDRRTSVDAFGALRALDVAGRSYRYFSLRAAEEAGLPGVHRLPVVIKILLENLLRNQHKGMVERDDIIAAATAWRGGSPLDIPYYPSRILLQDSAGIPLLADLAALRDAVAEAGADPRCVNPSVRVDLVIDHSVMVDVAGRADALRQNVALEYARNRERYEFLRWTQGAFQNLRLIPPGNAIVHQANLEFLSDVIASDTAPVDALAYPDTLLGVDSHTPMVNALGVVGWGAGGIENAAVLLGQPVSMAVPRVLGVKLIGALRAGVTSTDLALTVTERLRRQGVVQKFVEFFGSGLQHLSVPARAAIANMAPEYGATVGFFPVDELTLAYLRLTGRDPDRLTLVETYAKTQGLWRGGDVADPDFDDVLEIDLSQVVPSLAGPHRPQDRVPLSGVRQSYRDALTRAAARKHRRTPGAARLGDGSVVIAAVTSCTNTSDPVVMITAGLLARNALARGLTAKPWVKTSFAPGSRVVADYLAGAGLQPFMDGLGFHVVGFGCTTCMGNSGPLNAGVAEAIDADALTVAAVLSGNRNFDGRIHPKCGLNYLASPPLVVAYAIAGTLDIDMATEPLGRDAQGKSVRLSDIWPEEEEVEAVVQRAVSAQQYRSRYADIFDGGPRWDQLAVSSGNRYAWRDDSSYIRRPPFVDGVGADVPGLTDIHGARALLIVGNSITTDHISPVGTIASDGAAGRYLLANGIAVSDFNSYAARRVNHEVMVRGTFGNIALRNEMLVATRGGYTLHMPDRKQMTIYDAAALYRRERVPVIVLAGADYGVGSARDWAAKGVSLLGVRAVIAESFERIHRSNLVGMGVTPLQFMPGTSCKRLGLDGSETFDITGLQEMSAPRAFAHLRITRADGRSETLRLACRVETACELEYVRHGGILPYTLRRLLKLAA